VLNLQSGLPYSLIKNGLPYSYPSLQQHLTTDVAVIGGGISGALTAYALASAGVPAVVVDGRSIGLGSTCASTSLIQYEIDVPLSRLAEKIGREQAETAYQLSYASVQVLQQICQKIKTPFFEPKTSVFLASTQKHVSLIEQEYTLRKAMGFDVLLWNHTLVQKHLGFDAPAALYSELAAQTDAYMLTHALHQHNGNKGIQVFERTRVTNIQRSARQVLLQTEAGYHIKAKYLVMATGYEAMQYINEPLVKLHSTYAVASESTGEQHQWYKNCLIWETKEPYLYLRTTPDHRIIVGGRDETFYNPSRRDKLIHKKTGELVNDFNKKFPGILFKPEFKWTGTFATTADGLPFIGTYPALPRTFFALGFGGNGITFSQMAAGIITDLITGKKNEAAKLFAFGRGG
jgi:glycine/D-amino acid oxidase-like deaminating enzyme